MKKKLIPRIYSTHITPSYLGLYSGFRKKVEGVRGGTQRTRIKMGSEGGEGGQAASGRIGVEAYRRNAHLGHRPPPVFSCLADESSHRPAAVQSSAISPLPRLYHPALPLSASMLLEAPELFFSCIRPSRKTDRL